jgi:uncharacterized SAM-binding protein YcdF (DUF218 family)
VLVLRLSWPWLCPNTTSPQVLFVLGGDTQREIFAAEVAAQNPDLPVWVTGGSNPEFAEYMFENHGISLDRVNLDYRAVDTVTNFTTLVNDLERDNIKSVYLVTSSDHMRRALWIGRIVLGSRGIRIQPLPVATEQPPEPLSKTVRDAGRSLIWLVTGRTGASIGQVGKLQELREELAFAHYGL